MLAVDVLMVGLGDPVMGDAVIAVLGAGVVVEVGGAAGVARTVATV